ncbi:uncharacterized protein LOC127510977 isoform X33 [Ctenopharyngodon idella]|uniref:uncharacterized protein LOC127510977 isoform X1 n=1 Tax=Ctenopharyngodon idella TaxID=7959 RepID=UPI002231ED01|nr:uncharacterized protein LOC127510977 isoform X1 [Ctenopharyngodon idella]XP_051747162.1 uncharacterized protein LOC127510977 isoform X2 [Ctenopharyngodon idella]XP_051747172.1 uncharacterized protein LOC127510977 isoform X3 [Ctenopharyngodon idella]XP_051747180.1 uncharacterized protein LOC127510977 isoform X4 [Ctenopharyngodon idella]XP_051747189.1 uncharacterized protein LOC127510977 isoform X5 [Ctenopharyngodon idella]XP_051747199.1 uncharacterized protein LOC127510977 isoform X6 [Ctenop
MPLATSTSEAPTNTDTTAVASTTISTNSESATSLATTTTTASTTTMIPSTTTSDRTSSEAASTTTKGPSTTTVMSPITTATTSAATSSEIPGETPALFTVALEATSTAVTTTAAAPTTFTTSESTTAHATTTSPTTLVPSTTASAATSSEAPSTTTQTTTTSTLTVSPATSTLATTTNNSPTTETQAQTSASAQSTSIPTAAITTAFQITTAPLSSTTIAFTNTAPALSQTALTTTTAPPIITTVSPENITISVTIMPISTTQVTLSPTSTPTKTTEPPRTPTASMTTETALYTTTVPADISTTVPSTTATQTTTTFQATTGGLLSTTVAFASTSPAPGTLTLSTKTTSGPTTVNSETTTASTTITGIITGLTNTVEIPIVVPVTIPGLEIQNPATTSTSSTNVTGAAIVTTKLVFSSLSSLPNEALVLGAINSLLKSRESQLNESLKIVNVTYQKISETSYAVIFKCDLSNVSMPEDPKFRNNTYMQVQNVVNNALNTLLNEPGNATLQPTSSNFTSTLNQIDGSMGYNFQDGDAIQPVSFLNELRLQLQLTTTTVFPDSTTGSSVTSPNLISGSAVVTSKLLFNSSSPVPSEALVLSAINTLRQRKESQLNDSVKVVNVTYQKISETSYAVVITFSLSNISMPEVPELRNNTYTKVQDVVNNALNTLLNEPGNTTLQPKSSNFTSTSNQIDGSMGYNFQDGDAIQPVSFLNELRLQLQLTTTTVFPDSTTGSSVTSPNLISGSAVVTSKLLFNSSSPVPSEALVLSAINTLRQRKESQLNDSVKVVNVTYQKISETSYAVVITFSLSNISMPEVPELRNNTYTKVQDVVNNALNTLLNEPGNTTLQPKSSNFTSTSNQIDGSMGYNFQDGDAIQPVSFLNELRLQLQLTTTTVFPESTTGSSVTSPNLISGSAVVTSKLLFNSSSPVPSEALVLSAINTLRRRKESQLNDSVKVVNVTYQKISETSYAVVITFSLSNISMPEVPELRNNTYTKVQDVVNNALNTLLNEPGNTTLQPKSSNFTSTSNQIDGSMGYNFQDGDAIQPVSFLNELRLQLQLTTTTVFPDSTTGSSVTSPNLISGSAVVTSKLLFNSSSPVPSEALVLSAINTLRQRKESQLNDSVKVVNVTYQKISETSYAVVITFSLSNISMPEVPELRNNTYTKVQDVVNNALNTLLNEPGNTTLQPKSSNFTSTSNQIDGSMGYNFQDGDAIQPVSFLNELRLQLQLTTTTVFPDSTTGSSVTSPNLISGSAVVTSKLLFNSSSPVPSEALVLSAINTLRQRKESQLNDSVKVVNVTYQKISETSYAVVITFSLSNISMPEVPELRNNTYTKVQDVVNNALNTLLNEPGNTTLQPKSSNFTSTSNQIDGSMGYNFQDGDAIQPVSFLNELRLQLQLTTTTVFPDSTTGSSVTSPNLISGSAVVTSKLLFNSSSPVPSEALVLSAINTLRQRKESQLNDSVKVVNVTYQKISETSYAVVITFSLSNISMPEVPELRNNTYTKVQDVVNNALNTLLNEPGNTTLQPKSSNFTSTSNQIDGSMGYNFQDGDAIQPVSFLNELRLQLQLTTTTVFPDSTTGSSVTSPNLISGSAVVTSKLLFNSSSPVPSEALVLSAINTLRQRKESQLNDSVKVVNVTYQKISETSYAVVITFSLSNISMPEVPELRNNTYTKVQDVVNNALNTLLNEPGNTTLQPKSSNFTSTSNQIDGSMGYNFQDGDAIQPVSFLNELRLQLQLTTTTVFPDSTTGSSVTSPNLISGSAVVTSKLLFNSSSPVPSEALVLSAINTLRQRKESQLNDSVKVVNVTYQKISETSYAVVITFSLSNISMPEVPELRNNTYTKVQDVVNNALNTLLNEPGNTTLQPKSSNFTSTSNQIDGSMGYNFQDGDAIQPVSFLNELRLQLQLTTTTVFPDSTTGSSVTSPNLISGSAVVTSKLLFNSSSPVPSEALVLSAINTLRQRKESQLNDSVKVVNVTYQKISETSYAVVITFSLSNISMPEVPELRNNTYTKVQDVVNNALNTLLNEPGNTTLQPKSSNFTSSSNQIDGSMGYTFQDGDAIQPFSFLNELRLPTDLTTASPLTTITTSPPTLIGRVIIFIRIVFVTLGPLPNENEIVQVANNLLYSRLATKLATRTEPLSDPVNFVNITYTKINETAYALNFGFEISNVSMSEKLEFRNETYLTIQDSINTLLNKILNNESAPTIKFQPGDFTEFSGNSSTIQANVTYVFSNSNITQPSIFIKQLLQAIRESTLTTASPLTTASTATPQPISKVVIKIRLVFVTLGPIPSESDVLRVVKSVLASNLTTKLTTRATVIPSNPVIKADVTYSRINDTAYALDFEFEIINLSVNNAQKDQAYGEIQNKINNLVIEILSNPSAALPIIQASFNDSISSIIIANVTYIFSQNDSNSYTLFGRLVGQLFITFTTPAPTTINTTVSNNSTNAAWVVAIIVPVAIVLGLIPCWILLCCLLCGCCAAIRRRWHRRQSYNVQYTTRNSLF